MAKKPKATAVNPILQGPWVLLDKDGGAPDNNWHRFAEDPGPPAPGRGQKATTRCGIRDAPWRVYCIGIGQDPPTTFLAEACQARQKTP